MKTFLAYLFLCVVAAWIPSCATDPGYDPDEEDFPGWEAAPLPPGLAAVAPGERETRFAAGFPGKIGVFSDGQKTYVVRWVRQPTRKLHPATDCLRGLGYSLKPGPLFAAADGTHWGTSHAGKAHARVRVRERIVDSVGREWTDVSAWYWQAVLRQSCGPWWAVTILEPELLGAAAGGPDHSSSSTFQ